MPWNLVVVSFGSVSNYSPSAMERVVGEPPPKTRERVQLQRPAVDDGQLALDVALEVVDGYAEGLGRLRLVEGQAGHVAREALAGSVTFESIRAI
jgi:hypothetical protein